jgi:DNA replication initiation complex subunit (GINS family)
LDESLDPLDVGNMKVPEVTPEKLTPEEQKAIDKILEDMRKRKEVVKMTQQVVQQMTQQAVQAGRKKAPPKRQPVRATIPAKPAIQQLPVQTFESEPKQSTVNLVDEEEVFDGSDEPSPFSPIAVP